MSLRVGYEYPFASYDADFDAVARRVVRPRGFRVVGGRRPCSKRIDPPSHQYLGEFIKAATSAARDSEIGLDEWQSAVNKFKAIITREELQDIASPWQFFALVMQGAVIDGEVPTLDQRINVGKFVGSKLLADAKEGSDERQADVIVRFDAPDPPEKPKKKPRKK